MRGASGPARSLWRGVRRTGAKNQSQRQSPCEQYHRADRHTQRPRCNSHGVGAYWGRPDKAVQLAKDRLLELPGGVAEWLRQGPAKPRTAVRFRPPPLERA